MTTLTTAHAIHEAARRLQGVVRRTPLVRHEGLSLRYGCTVFLKREDLQVVRSYKLRGAYNLMSSLSAEEMQRGVVCASAGNHAQGFAWSCRQLGLNGMVFMPVITPRQKISQTRMFGENSIEIRLAGDTYDSCSEAAQVFAAQNNMIFIPPFDHPRIIEGQGTVALEILDDLPQVDFLFVPVGGGGLSAGMGAYFKTFSPKTTIVGVEPQGAPAMYEALRAGKPVTLEQIDRFVDGAAVKRAGDLTFAHCREVLDDLVLVHEGLVCSTILKLYAEDAVVAEPAGALGIAALEQYADRIAGKNVVCVLSGGNNDIDRMPEIKERSLQYEGLKHYFIISFPQRPGALREFVVEVLGPDDDIVHFEYMRKNYREAGPALVGIEFKQTGQLERLRESMRRCHFSFDYLNGNSDLLRFLL
ncbi:MAG: threonine ammonia-lyase IlvA [Saprospiraceae bacterium]|nr:threonine ammonia-lyase IlvA [Saprospiraceae bacterium]